MTQPPAALAQLVWHDRVSFERRSDPVALSEQRRHHRSLNRSLRAARKKHWI